MRKFILQLSLILLFPYLIIFAVFCMYSGFLMATVFHNNALELLLFILIIYFFAFICTVLFVVTNLRKHKPAFEMTRISMIIKLIHIPAYIVIFLMGLLSLATIFTMGFGLVFLILNCMTIFLTGLIGASGIAQGKREEKLSKKSAVIHGILQFMFCVDVISAVIIHRRIKLLQKDSNHSEQSG